MIVMIGNLRACVTYVKSKFNRVKERATTSNDVKRHGLKVQFRFIGLNRTNVPNGNEVR